MNMDDALRRAKAEYDSRPNNIDVLETYAWTLYKSGKANDAVPLIQRAMRLNTQSYSLAYHAGKIYQAVGQSEKAKFYLDAAEHENRFVKTLIVDDGNPQSGMKQSAAAIQ